MQSTELSAVLIALGVVLALAVLVTLVWRAWVHRLNGENPEERYRRDIWAVRRERRIRATGRRSGDVWSAGAASDPAFAGQEAGATLATGLAVGGCGGCGGCGCGG